MPGLLLFIERLDVGRMIIGDEKVDETFSPALTSSEMTNSWIR